MSNTPALHSKGWAGLAFAILVVAQAVLAGINLPLAHASASEVAAYLNAHRQALLIGGWLTMPITGFFLWFTVGISRFLRDRGREDEGLPTFALITGVAIGITYLIWQTAISSLAFAGDVLTPNGLAFWWSLQSLAGNVFMAFTTTFFVFAVAHSMRRHGSAPMWLAWLGYITALAQAVMSFGIFSPTTIPGNSMPLFVLAFGLFVLWTICTAGYLVLLPGEAAAPAAQGA